MEEEQMIKIQRIAKLLAALLAGGFLVAVLSFINTPVVKAHAVPSPCDFTTGGGFVITDTTLTDGGNHANFGLVGGCKPDRFFGHFNFVDHDTSGFFAGWHVNSYEITAYVDPSPTSKYRDICGKANTNNPTFPQVFFRVRTLDKAEPGVGADRFGLELGNINGSGEHMVVVTTRFLAGGNIQLHKPAPPGTTGPSMTEDQITAACGGMTGDDLGF
jgi:hypothetical protein